MNKTITFVGRHASMVFVKILQVYTRINFKVKGSYYLINIENYPIMKFNDSIIAKSKDNRRFDLRLPEDRFRLSIFTTGYCEKYLTNVLKKIIRNDDVVIDIGANIGWFTTQFADEGKQCHAFEPNPHVFNKLKKNCELNGIEKKCILNNCAVGKNTGKIKFFTFKNLHHGLCSISDFNREDKEEINVNITTLYGYLAKNNISKIDLIKVDVEGAELDVLEGFAPLFKKKYFPIWTFELNNKTSKAFNYSPKDILNKLHNIGYTQILIREKIIKIDNFNSYNNGDIVLAYIESIHGDRIRNVL